MSELFLTQHPHCNLVECVKREWLLSLREVESSAAFLETLVINASKASDDLEAILSRGINIPSIRKAKLSEVVKAYMNKTYGAVGGSCISEPNYSKGCAQKVLEQLKKNLAERRRYENDL